MNSNVYNVFSLNIKRIEDFITEDECKKIAKCIQLNEDPVLSGLDGILVGDTFVSLNLFQDILIELDKETNNDLKERLQQAVSEYCKEQNIIESFIDQSWVVVQHKESLLKHHTHLDDNGEGVISGALWINIPENSSNLEFIHPFEYHSKITKDKPTLKFPAKTGTLILFPSYVWHGNDAWNHSTNRIVISFNAHKKENVNV
jgi:hypothetical protein